MIEGGPASEPADASRLQQKVGGYPAQETYSLSKKIFILCEQYANRERDVQQLLPRYLSEDLELIKKRVMRIILPYYKYRDALKVAKIDTLYVRRESLSLKLFN